MATAKKPAAKKLAAPVKAVKKPGASPAAKAASPAAKPAAKVAAKALPAPVRTLASIVPPPVPKAAAKPLVKAATNPAGKPGGAPLGKPAAKAAKPEKIKKPKQVRDSFTMPKTEYAVLDVLKLRASKAGNAVKKSELLRAGIKALAAMSEVAFADALKAVPAIKTGRPKLAGN
ncbi:hypothetical protein BH11PSE7_BH11PSE7_01890 [soil metagenome]